MKLRPFLVLSLFVVSAGILVWIYYAAKHGRQSVSHSPWAGTISDLDACCRHKHVKAAQYEHFATVADEEHQGNASRLFRAMALSERINEHNCVTALTRLGGAYVPPQKVVVFRASTNDNLARSIAYELRTLKEHNGEEITRALEKGNRYAARVLIWAAAGDMQHVILMEHCSHSPDMKGGYGVCPKCGNVYDLDYCDYYCPYCMTANSEFIRFD